MMKHTLPALLLFSTPRPGGGARRVPLENIPLGDAATLSFDGSLRERYEWTDQRDLSGGRDDTFMQRLLVGARLDYGDYFGAYVQVGSSLATPRDRGRKPTDEDHAYLGQGYVDLKLPTAYGLGTLRVGRQEIALGSLHLMGTRDGPNVRRSFDAVRASWAKDKTASTPLSAIPSPLKPAVSTTIPTTAKRCGGCTAPRRWPRWLPRSISTPSALRIAMPTTRSSAGKSGVIPSARAFSARRRDSTGTTRPPGSSAAQNSATSAPGRRRRTPGIR